MNWLLIWWSADVFEQSDRFDNLAIGTSVELSVVPYHVAIRLYGDAIDEGREALIGDFPLCHDNADY